MSDQQLSFPEWLAALDQVAEQHGFQPGMTKETGAEAWRSYFENEYSPLEAFLEDCSYGVG